MEEYDAESQKVEEARLAFYRAQRKCIEEIVQSVHDVEDGPLAKMRRISKAEGRGDDTHKFFEAELKGITDVFGTDSMKYGHRVIFNINNYQFVTLHTNTSRRLKPAGWCRYSEVVPVMAWVNSLTYVAARCLPRRRTPFCRHTGPRRSSTRRPDPSAAPRST